MATTQLPDGQLVTTTTANGVTVQFVPDPDTPASNLDALADAVNQAIASLETSTGAPSERLQRVEMALACLSRLAQGRTSGVLPTPPAPPDIASGLATSTDLSAKADSTDARFPTPGQKNALAGTSGTPGSTNQFVTQQDSRLSDARSPIVHTHPESEVTNLVADLAAKAATSHIHAQADVTGLVAALAAKANAAAVPNASYRTLLQSSGSHTAARAAGTYGMGQGDPLAVTGIGILYPLNTIYIAAADYPTLDGVAAKLRVRARLYTNDVAPTGNYTVGLHPITRPATSGGAGLCTYTIGAAVAGSTTTFTAPAADGLLNAVGFDLALPADGHYVLGVVTTATVATSAHVHISASLQLRNA
jgi:hypothetical protein